MTDPRQSADATQVRRPTPTAPTDTARDRRAQRKRGGDQGRHRNEVVLVGRLTAAPLTRELPSGGLLTTWRLAVERPPDAERPGCRVDAVPCVTFDDEVRAVVSGWQVGQTVEVHGALRRHFWRSPAGPASRYEVEVCRAVRSW